jgi:hypothetical protein
LKQKKSLFVGLSYEERHKYNERFSKLQIKIQAIPPVTDTQNLLILPLSRDFGAARPLMRKFGRLTIAGILPQHSIEKGN